MADDEQWSPFNFHYKGPRRVTIDSAHHSIAPSIAPSRANSPQSRASALASAVADLSAVAAVPELVVTESNWVSTSEFAYPPASSRGRSKSPRARAASSREASTGATSSCIYSGDEYAITVVDSEDGFEIPQSKDAADKALVRQTARRETAWPMVPTKKCSSLPEGESSSGNLTALYFNFGCQGKDNKGLREHLTTMLRRGPGIILAGCEVSDEYVEALEREVDPNVELERLAIAREAAAAGASTSAVADTRREFSFKCVLMKGDRPCMVAVRENDAVEMHCLHSQLYDHGNFKKAPGKWSPSVSKILIVKIELRRPICILPREPVVMVLHFHFVTAKGESGKKAEQAKLLKTIVRLVEEHEVTLLCTDANMALLLVMEELRSSGVHADTLAWWPWRLEDGSKGMDSCAIILINHPGSHKPTFGLEKLKNDTLWRDANLLPSRVEGGQLRDHHGFGQLTTAYLPKGKFEASLEAFLRPSVPADELEDIGRSRGRDAATRGLSEHNLRRYNSACLKTRQLPLTQELFLYEGKFPNGCHYPLCMATTMNSRRSAKALAKRNAKKWNSQAAVAAKGAGRSSGPPATAASPFWDSSDEDQNITRRAWASVTDDQVAAATASLAGPPPKPKAPPPWVDPNAPACSNQGPPVKAWPPLPPQAQPRPWDRYEGAAWQKWDTDVRGGGRRHPPGRGRERR